MKLHIATFVVAAALLAAPAHALNEPVWLQINGGGANYGMTDLNDELRTANEANAGTGFAYPLLRNGLGLGFAIGIEFQNRWSFGVGLDRLFAETSASDASGALRYQFTANAWRGFAEYSLRPLGAHSLRFGFGAGVLGESGKLTVSIPDDAPSDYRITGAGPLYEASAGGDFWATPQFAITSAFGYRYAKLKSVNLEGDVFISANGEAMQLDYTGPYARVGIKLASRPQAD